MNFSLLFPIAQIVFAVFLVTSILLQRRGTGLGSAFGGEGNVFATRRGVERILFIFSVIFSVLLFSTALAQFLLR